MDETSPPPNEVELRYRAKALLRKRARALRNTIPADAIAARASKIVAALTALDEIATAKSVSLFYPIEGRNEVDLRPFDRALRERGVAIAYPSIDPDTRVMTFRFVDETESMEERGLGFREPDPSSSVAERLDAIIVPALAVDPRCHRIGYGAGFYDRALAAHPTSKAIGVAFDFQLIPEVPDTEGDRTLDLVVTDARIVRPA